MTVTFLVKIIYRIVENFGGTNFGDLLKIGIGGKIFGESSKIGDW